MRVAVGINQMGGWTRLEQSAHAEQPEIPKWNGGLAVGGAVGTSWEDERRRDDGMYGRR